MKKILLFSLLFGLFMFNACKDDEEPTTEPDYHAHIEEPANNAVFQVGDTLHVHVNFEEHDGGTVHNINVRAYNKATGDELFNEPTDAHIHASGSHTFEHEHILNVATGTYVLEAKVWGHDDNVAEEVSTQEFTVN